MMDRGLCLVLQARPTKTASTRFLYIAPCVRDTLPWQGGLLSRHHRWIPGCLSLYPSPPSGWVWDLLSSEIQGKLSAPLRIRAVPGTQQCHKLGRQKAAPVVPPYAAFCLRLWLALGIETESFGKLNAK